MRTLVLVLLAFGPTASLSVARAQPAPRDEPIDILEALEVEPSGLTADRAAERAVRVAESIHRAGQGSRAASAAADQVVAGLFPRLDLSARYTRLSEVDQPPFEFMIGGTTMQFDNPFPQILDNFAFRASVTIPLSDLLLAILPAYQGASAYEDAARYQVVAEERNVAIRAREAFYGYVQARGTALVARDGVRLLEAYVADLERLVTAGVLPQPDLADARAQLASARADVVRADAAVETTETVIRRMLDLEDDAPIHIGEDLLQPITAAPPSHREIVARAIENRPEASAIRSLIEARDALVQAREAGRYPHLALSGNIDIANPNQRIIPQVEEFRPTWDANVIVSWSPNDLAVAQTQVAQAEAELAQARDDLAQIEDGIAIEAAQALAAMRASGLAIEAAREGLEAAQLAYRSRRELLAAGAATPSDVLSAETRLRGAQLARLTAHVAQRIAHARLAYVMGEAGSEER
jgi:outer membrane protein TolC